MELLGSIRNGLLTIGGEGRGGLIITGGGITMGSQYDHINSSSLGNGATFGGCLKVILIGNFNPSEGQSFDLFDGALHTTFNNINLPGHGANLGWDTSRLYTTGEISVTTVPGPAAGCAGMALLALLAAGRKRCKVCGSSK